MTQPTITSVRKAISEAAKRAEVTRQAAVDEAARIAAERDAGKAAQ